MPIWWMLHASHVQVNYHESHFRLDFTYLLQTPYSLFVFQTEQRPNGSSNTRCVEHFFPGHQSRLQSKTADIKSSTSLQVHICQAYAKTNMIFPCQK